VRHNSFYDPRYRAIVLRLIQARKRAGLNQQELAERIGIGQPELSKIERFVRKIEVLELIYWIKATEAPDLEVAARTLEESSAKHKPRS
jgi:transcriptional regulator with XRE-family HTH domain